MTSAPTTSAPTISAPTTSAPTTSALIPSTDRTSSPSTTLTTCSALECVKLCFTKMNECMFQDSQNTDLWSSCTKTLFCSVMGCGASRTVLNDGQPNQEHRLNYPIGEGHCAIDSGTGYSKLHCKAESLSKEHRESCQTGAEYFKQFSKEPSMTPFISSPNQPTQQQIQPSNMTSAPTISAPTISAPTTSAPTASALIPSTDRTSSPSTTLTTCSALECVKLCFTKMNECMFQDSQNTDLWSSCTKTLFCSVMGCGASRTVLNDGQPNQEHRLNYPIGEGHCAIDSGTGYSKLHCKAASLSKEHRESCRTGAEYFKQFSKEPSMTLFTSSPNQPTQQQIQPFNMTSAPTTSAPTISVLTTSAPTTSALIPSTDRTSSPSTTLTTCSALECVKLCFTKMNECMFQDSQNTDLWSSCTKTLFCSVMGCG